MSSHGDSGCEVLGSSRLASQSLTVDRRSAWSLDDPLDRQRLLIEVNKTSRGGGLRRQLDRYLQVKTKEWMAGLYYPGKS